MFEPFGHGRERVAWPLRQKLNRLDHDRLLSRAHLTGKDDGITARAPIRERFPDFADLIASADAEAFTRLRAAESIGRPLGDGRFLAKSERATKRRLKPRKRGPKPQPHVNVRDK